MPDKQESMNRFAQMLLTGFRDAGFETQIWRPAIVVGGLISSSSSCSAKWLGYIDKWILFPLLLQWRLRKCLSRRSRMHFHVCDHSNAPYIAHLPSSKVSITCHDVLAIRGALGHKDTYCTASRFGKILQRWICHYLIRSKKVICVSENTFRQLNELTNKRINENRDWRVIHIGFNQPFQPMTKKEAALVLERAGYTFNDPFLLHVGSALPRKNRKLLIEMLHKMGDKWKGKICFAGEVLEPALLLYAQSFNLGDKIISVVKPDHSVLVALYSASEAFIFPSFSEGFGWPLIEAQACGTPVIASDIPPMPEISGGSALHCDPNKPELFADAFDWLQVNSNRTETIRRGFQNVLRFDTNVMIKAYIDAFAIKQ